MVDENKKPLSARDRFKKDEGLSKKNIAEFTTVGNTTVVGEEHIKTNHDRENESDFNSRINASDIVVLEHDPSLPTNYYTKASPFKRFMQSAQEHAKDTKKPIYILDSNIDNSLESRYQLLKKGGYNISKPQYAYATSVNTISTQFLAGVPLDEIQKNLQRRFEGFLPSSEAKEVTNRAVSHFELTFKDPQLLTKFQNIQKNFALIDRQTHEQEYQRQILQISRGNPDKKITFVVGKSHMEAIEKSLRDNSYTTPVDEELYGSLENALPSFEEHSDTEYPDGFEAQEESRASVPHIQTPIRQPRVSPRGGYGNVENGVSRGINSIANSAQRLASNTANNIKTAAKTGIKKGLGKIAAAAAPFLAKAALTAAAGVAIILAVLALIARILVTILLWTIGFTLFVVFILFIINSGAYMVPPGENLSSTPTIGDSQCTENERPECPCGWPVLPAEGEGVLDVYQGSHTIQGGTHNVIEAIDIIHLPEGYLAPGHPVTSRVTGTVRRVWSDPQVYGNAVEIESVCQGNSIVLRYGHNTAVVVAQGEEVAQNQVIAYSGDSGMGGPHVHYEFANPTSFAMQPVYIPKQVPEACNSWSGNPYPCNVQIP